MHPLLIPGLPVQTFGLCIAVGALLAWRLVERLARDRPDVGNLLFLLLVKVR